MANWSDLKSAVASIVKTNGKNEITGQLLQNVLNNIISNVGLNSTFAGIATPETNPGTPDGNVFYIATTAGTYSNFNGIVIKAGEAVILEWKGSWVKKDSGFATKEKLTELSQKLSNVNIKESLTNEEEIVFLDDDNNELLRINNDGIFISKLFDKEGNKIKNSGVDTESNDVMNLEFCDENSIPILIITDEGHIKTAKFSSEEIVKNIYKGKTMLYIGDSISTGDIWKWKGFIYGSIGLDYVRYDVDDNINVTPAVGGITIMPNNDDDTRPMSAYADETASGAKSIWWRCGNRRLNNYEFDAITLFGGTNDAILNYTNIGTINDKPLLDTDVNDLSSFDLSSVSFASAYMGCIEMLIRDFPGKEIILCTLLYNGLPNSGEIVKIQMLAAEKYGLKIIPFYFCVINETNYTYLCKEYVHPGAVAAKIMAKTYTNYLN